MSVSERDRLHFRLIAQAKLEEKEQQRREAVTGSAERRVATGFLLARIVPARADGALLDELALGQLELARLARSRNLR
jgi:hypothetical protein